MRTLVDTHVFLWALSDPTRLSASRRTELESRANIVCLSSISIAEISIKISLGRMEFDCGPIERAEEMGFDLLSFSAADALLLKSLPFHHRDPFDRMLVAQSIVQSTKLMSDDRNFTRYDCELVNP